MKRLIYLAIGMFTVLLLSGGCYITLYPCINDEDQNYYVMQPFWPQLNEARIIEQALTANIWDYNVTTCPVNYVSQIVVDTDGDTLGNQALGTQTCAYDNLGYYAPYTSETFPSAWYMCKQSKKSCVKTWTSVFHECNDFGQPDQFDGMWLDQADPPWGIYNSFGYRNNWMRVSLGYRPGECYSTPFAGNFLDRYNISMEDALKVLQSGTQIKWENQDAVALPINAGNLQITLTQGSLSRTIDLGSYKNTIYLILAGFHPMMTINAHDKALLPALKSYAGFLEAAEPGSFTAKITYNGVTGIWPYSGLDSKKEILQSVQSEVRFLEQAQ